MTFFSLMREEMILAILRTKTMSISGLLMAICVKILYGGILLAAAFCMFFAAYNFRIKEDEDDKNKKH